MVDHTDHLQGPEVLQHLSNLILHISSYALWFHGPEKEVSFSLLLIYFSKKSLEILIQAMVQKGKSLLHVAILPLE